MLEGKTVVITGGAGFIGGRLAETLVGENEVRVVDNLSSGKREYVPDDAELHVLDVVEDTEELVGAVGEADIVFHLAAEPDVRAGIDDTEVHLRQNTVATNNVLDAARRADVDAFAFTSTSTVYGEAPTPTPETYGPMEPISLYGASKLACEGLCTAYDGTFGIDSWVFRFANVVGRRGHGVVPDFVDKLRDDPERLEILGDGRQRKSYFHVSDCVEAMVHAVENARAGIYNIGTRDTISVTKIAEIVSDEMELDPEFDYTGG
ncbi:MAG: NAD-dependent epimerase/dehydratase family protein, partial [Halobacteria archaeon]|nr:NAD-dependent epimerase/dehydratase family protein [Halobacteria archaeon]